MTKRLNEIMRQDPITGYWVCPLTGEEYSDGELQEYQDRVDNFYKNRK